MNLSPREKDKLLISMAAMVARRRLERGVKLNHPEAVAIISDFIVEGARDGRTVADLMQAGGQVLTRAQVMPGYTVDDVNPNLLLVGFKLTHDPDAGAQARAARELLKRSRARYVVQNDVSTLAAGEEHLFFVHENGSSRVRRYVGRDKLATALAHLLEEQLKGTAR